MSKEQLRSLLKEERAAVALADRELWDRQIQARLNSWGPCRHGQKIMVYLSFNWEINTWPLVKELLAKGKEVYVPVVQKSPRALLPVLYTAETVLTSGDFGIKEPVASSTIDSTALDLVIVPGLAFNSKGYRIGHGGGYYDRFLATTDAVSVGLCYSGFIREFPWDSWDLPVQFLATENGIVGRK